MKALVVLVISLLVFCHASKRQRPEDDNAFDVDEPDMKRPRIVADRLQAIVPVAPTPELPADILSYIFVLALEAVPEEQEYENAEEDAMLHMKEHSWIEGLQTFQLVSRSFYACTLEGVFDSLLQVHPITAADWLVMKRPAVGQQQNIDLARKIAPLLQPWHYTKLIEEALDIDTVQELSILSYCCSKNTVDPIAPLLQQVLPEEHLGVLLEKMSMSLPSIADGVDANKDIPLIFQIKPLNLIKVMALEFPTAFFRLSPSFLFVMLSITQLWRDPVHWPFLTELISMLSTVMLARTQVYSCAMKVLSLPLILAGLAEERDFFSILPTGFFEQQLKVHADSKSNYDFISYLRQFHLGTIPSIDVGILETHCWHIVDEHVFGFQGFDQEKLAAVITEFFDRPGSWNILLSMLLFKGTGDGSYLKVSKRYYRTLKNGYKML